MIYLILTGFRHFSLFYAFSGSTARILYSALRKIGEFKMDDKLIIGREEESPSLIRKHFEQLQGYAGFLPDLSPG